MAKNEVSHASVIIVGGGVGGMTLAVACKKLGIGFIVLERKAGIEPLGAGLTLSPNSSRMLDQLGVYDQIRARGQLLRKQLVYNNNTFWRAVHFGDLPKKFAYGFANIERSVYHDIVYELSGKGDNVMFNTTVKDIVDDPSAPHVVVELSDGRKLTANVVVGADGVRSLTRRLLAVREGQPEANTIKFTGRRHLVGYTGSVPYYGPEHTAIGVWLFYDDGIFTTWPCKGHKITFGSVKVFDREDAASHNAVWSDVSVHNQFNHLGDRFHPHGKNQKVADITGLCERAVATDNYEEVSFPSMASGRICLIGDAAHAMAPFAGQGANQCLEDVVVLVNYLDDIQKQAVKPDYATVTSTLKAFSDSRADRVRTIVKFSSLWAKVHTATLPYGLGKIARTIYYRWCPDWVWFRVLRFIYEVQPTIRALPDNGPAQPPNNEWSLTAIFTILALFIGVVVMLGNGQLARLGALVDDTAFGQVANQSIIAVDRSFELVKEFFVERSKDSVEL